MADVPPRSPPDPPLADARVTLRPLDPGDVPAIVAACNDPLTRRFITAIPVPYTESDARGWLALSAVALAAGEGIDLAICAPDAGFRGVIGARIDWGERIAVIGYWLAPEGRGRGAAAGALRLLSAWLCGSCGIERIELSTDPENLASQRVARAAGFELEGRARAKLRYRRDGRRRDALLFARLASAQLPRAPGRAVWLNGAFGSGKSSVAALLRERHPKLTVPDPEFLGAFLQTAIGSTHGDFQDLPAWRDASAASIAALAHQTGAPLLVPMSVWRQDYLLEIFARLEALGTPVRHVLLDAPDHVLRARIESDTAGGGSARTWRLQRLPDYRAAREALRLHADLVIDTAERSIPEVADQVDTLLLT